ncbi:Tigger transposable element-derived protein 4 [Eumeta japonica]|uniref:Tigger transposable element-derived protein 4 n=2 Tax=Eumeta variegata TaxID=151549 RepID=A0A4C1Y409_EUMVA|nr:Tigger transposable element-derived protein 4 [Eumeta japonica]
MSKRKIKVLSLSDKLKIVNAFESGKFRNEIQREFNLPESTYYKIIKSKDSIKSACSDGHGNIKRIRVSEFPNIEKCLLEWIKQTRDKNIPIDGPLLKKKSKEFATKLGIENFSASNGWLEGFKRRHDITFKKAAGESKSVNQAWYRGEKKSMKFAVPRIWREPTDHIHDCYFCVVNPSKRRAGKNAKKIEYPNLPSTSAPVPHSENFPVPSNPKQKAQGQLPLSQISSNSGDSEFVITSPSVEPHLINSEEFDDLVRDLNLPKLKAEILGSRLKQWNLLKNDVIISDQRKRHKTFSGFFTKKTDFVIAMM